MINNPDFNLFKRVPEPDTKRLADGRRLAGGHAGCLMCVLMNESGEVGHMLYTLVKVSLYLSIPVADACMGLQGPGSLLHVLLPDEVFWILNPNVHRVHVWASLSNIHLLQRYSAFQGT